MNPNWITPEQATRAHWIRIGEGEFAMQIIEPAPTAKDQPLWRRVLGGWEPVRRPRPTSAERARKWRLRNPEKARTYHAEWHARNGERVQSNRLRRLKPEQSLFCAFMPLDERFAEADAYVDYSQMSPLEILMAQEEERQAA